ncbi:LysR substrate-binding domain-containing protein [Pseudooceanicola marinus]|uniref:LysR substrate-binding domain-containing protein n=1 Tax=Pseudooceanicola marinus TaxID=396013 RepID=UPI001C973FE6|nr:LysR substrate-binding domain-containing protein [Pseudooceanicola marinus]MBY5974792.1 LysR family transcriptional regulator [Ferrimonas balearica]MCA1338056.1 LysR family transcriptional regulator [Pseudooceanicola marinus]
MIRYTLRQLEYFVAVGDAGSIMLAAGKVNVSSPSISAAISQLETEFGMPLFVRQHAQGLSLTQAGRTLMEQAKVVLREADRLVDLAGDISGTVRGPISVGGMLTFAQVVLPPLRKDFVEAFPEARFTQVELDANELVSALRRAEIDVALGYDLVLPPDMKFVPLIDLPPFVLIPAGHPLADREEIAVEELRTEPMVLLDLPQSSDYFLSFFHEKGIKPVITERSRDIAVVRSLVANGFGYSIANMRPLNGVSPDGKPLRFIPLAGDLRPMKMGLMMTHQAETTNVVRSFVEFAQKWFHDGFMPGQLAREVSGPMASPASAEEERKAAPGS